MSKEELIKSIVGQMRVIAEEVKTVLRAVMDSDVGVNTKTNVNTLSDSDLYNELETNVDSDDFEIVRLLVNDYIKYIEVGRRQGIFPPPEAIAAWCNKKGIPSDNSTVYLICRAIYNDGIPARPVMSTFFEEMDEYFDDWADMIANTLFEYIEDKLD